MKFKGGNNMKIIKFILPMSPYTTDDVASFDDAMANKIIEKGYAIEVTLESTKIVKEK